MRTTQVVLMPVLAAVAVSSAGCLGRLVGEGAEEALGPKGAYWEEKPVAPDKHDKALATYRNFKLGEVTNGFGRNLPADFIPLFRGEFDKQLQESHLPKEASGKTLSFKVNVFHYETADMTDNVFGPLEQVVAHVELVDGASGATVASGNAIGRTGKTVGLGVEWKARGLAKALLKWARDYYPKPEGEPEEKAAKKD